MEEETKWNLTQNEEGEALQLNYRYLRKLNNLAESAKKLKKLQNILEDIQIKNNKTYHQQYCEVLIENKLSNQEKYFGRTKYMTPVIFESNNCQPGELVNVKITSFNKKNLFGFHKNNKVKAA